MYRGLTHSRILDMCLNVQDPLDEQDGLESAQGSVPSRVLVMNASLER